MNIDNFKPFNTNFEQMFELQKELKFKFEPDSVEVYDRFDIDCFEDQKLFKDYSWRIVEELAEAMEAIQDEQDYDHYKEELIDGLNFTMDLLSLYGWSAKDLKEETNRAIRPYQTLGDTFFNRMSRTIATALTIKSIGLAANCLKNRKWRSSQYMVDIYVFEKRLRKIWEKYVSLVRLSMTEQEIYDTWSLKYQVNLFRIETQY